MSKLKVADQVALDLDQIRHLSEALLADAGCPPDVATQVVSHLIEAELSGVVSHGLVRVLQYTREFHDGTLDPLARPRVERPGPRQIMVDAQGGIGIPAMAATVQEACTMALNDGMSAAALVGAGHTGRLGAFAEDAAHQGVLTIILGGGNRAQWRQVAPYGGKKAVLPTNPWCIAVPGGDKGPVVLDAATSKIAGGWIYAAKAAGVELPEGTVIDAAGQSTRNPDDYFAGGAILPKGGPLGSGLALIAELLCEAMLGAVDKGEINWLVLAVDCKRFGSPETYQSMAEGILSEIRLCPPAAGFDRVEVPGERERARRAAADSSSVHLPKALWEKISEMAHDAGLVEEKG